MPVSDGDPLVRVFVSHACPRLRWAAPSLLPANGRRTPGAGSHQESTSAAYVAVASIIPYLYTFFADAVAQFGLFRM